ncbi:MAG: hypothetical protein SPJ71_08170 [Candidatus Limisoma sp.]|nr:hypothetical protein [Bacteroidales bacterium]MDY5894523.1 hypothetical protein [Candidatus Limisoma sp.]
MDKSFILSLLISAAIIGIIYGIIFLKYTDWYIRRQERKQIKRYDNTMERFAKCFERDYRRGKVKIPKGMTVEEYYKKSEEAYAQHLLQCSSYNTLYPRTPVQSSEYNYTKPIKYSPENIDDEIDEDYLFLNDNFRL